MFDVTCSASGTLPDFAYLMGYLHTCMCTVLTPLSLESGGTRAMEWVRNLVSTTRFYGAYSTPVTGPGGNNACTYLLVGSYTRCGADE